jgi:hypothetical protein
MKKKVKTFLTLTPTEFENLVFDLLISRGMVNVAWRTPGADGGRDIAQWTGRLFMASWPMLIHMKPITF